MSNVLVDIIPAKYRKYAYALVGLLSVGYGIWQATDHDWRSLLAAVVVALTTSTAAANTNAD